MRHRRVLALSATAAFVFIIVACGSSRPPLAEDDDAPGAPPAGAAGILTGPCSDEGKTVTCHVETGRVGSIVNCFTGTQVCENGTWSACGGTAGGSASTASIDVSGLMTSASKGGGDLHPLTVSATGPSADAGACASNPCDPYCLGIDVDAGGLTNGSFTTVGVEGTVSDPSSFPGGVSGPKAGAMNGVTSPTAHFSCAPGHPPTSYAVCAYDYCCVASGSLINTCQPWVTTGADDTNAAGCVNATGVDYELGLGCKDATDAHIHVPVCNRGTAASGSSGTLSLTFYSANPNAAGSSSVCTPNGSITDSCSITLAQNPIPVGKCIDIDVSQSASASPQGGITCTSVPTGERTMMVNPSYSVGIPNTAGSASESGSTVTITTSSAHGFIVGSQVMISGVSVAGYNGVFTITAVPTTTSFQYTNTTTGLASGKGGSAWSTPIQEADMCNNYSFLPNPQQNAGICSAYGVQPPPPTSNVYTYSATCTNGSRPQWNQFAYHTTNGGSSEILFSAKTAPLLADGGAGTLTSSVTVADVKSDGTKDPAPDCLMSGTPAGCPKNLATILGANAYDPVLEIDIAITATVAPAPVINSWQVTYNCVPNE